MWANTPEQVQTLLKKVNEDGRQQPKKKAQVVASSEAGGEAPAAPAPRAKKIPKEKAPKVPREPKTKPSKHSGEGGHGKSDSLFMQFARLERDGWNQDVRGLVIALAARI